MEADVSLFDQLWPVALVVIGTILGFGAKWLHSFVASTSTKKDDELLAAFKKALNDANGGNTPPAA